MFDDEGGGAGARYFEFVDGSSSKFWEIRLDGASFTTRYGKIGTDGQSTTKTFDSPAKAQKEYDKLVTEKTKKGYEET
ncbi:MAG: WGR domain-containing protein [Labilithrix sp.]|nr:WGR domain-containing protein [Labilithrix sp.]MCW5816764.1 WGR domain-containing protein [Labilithrix sp.]